MWLTVFTMELIFHDTIKNFAIQTGRCDESLIQKTTKQPIKNEAMNCIRNITGHVAMARTSVIDSATSEFFINLSKSPFLDHKTKKPEEFGYCVFGTVVEGLDIAKKIGRLKTVKKSVLLPNLPKEPVFIMKASSITSVDASNNQQDQAVTIQWCQRCNSTINALIQS